MSEDRMMVQRRSVWKGDGKMFRWKKSRKEKLCGQEGAVDM